MPNFFKNNKKSLFIALSCCAIILCLAIANLIASSVISADKNITEIKSNSFDLYMISLGKSQIKTEATTLSSDYQKIGAGGYIWEKDGYFYIISSAYQNKNDALLVQNSIKNKGIDSELILVHFNNIAINGSFSDDEGKALTKAVNIFEQYYLSLYDIAISFDTSVYNEISARLSVNNAHSNLTSTIANFETIFPDHSFSPIREFYSALTQALSSSKTLCSGLPLSAEQTYSSLIKYHYLEILNILFVLTN